MEHNIGRALEVMDISVGDLMMIMMIGVIVEIDPEAGEKGALNQSVFVSVVMMTWMTTHG